MYTFDPKILEKWKRTVRKAMRERRYLEIKFSDNTAQLFIASGVEKVLDKVSKVNKWILVGLQVDPVTGEEDYGAVLLGDGIVFFELSKRSYGSVPGGSVADGSVLSGSRPEGTGPDEWKLVTEYGLMRYRCGAVAGEQIRLRRELVRRDAAGVPTGKVHAVGEVWTVLRGVADEPEVVWLREPNGDSHVWGETVWEWFERVGKREVR